MDNVPISIFNGELDFIIWNLIATFIVFIYIMSIIKIMDKMVTKGFPQDISRKIIHISAGSWVVFWPLFYGGHWSYIFNIAVAVLWTLLFLVKGLTASSDDPAVKTMTRTGDPKELLRGPLFFTLVMEFIGIFYFMKLEGVLTMAALGWGDGLAPVFGKYYGKTKYSVWGNEKSLQGSLAMLIFTIIGALILTAFSNFIFNYQPADLIRNIVIVAFVATIVEAVSPKDIDNLLIPLSVLIVSLLII